MDPNAPRQKPTHLQAWLAFEAAARTGTFAAAAEELSVTPAAVSQHVRSLEDYLRVRLFARTNQGVQLTPEGEQVYPGVRDGFLKIADSVHKLQHRELDRIVRVSAPPSLASRWLLPRLHRFGRLHPSISVNLDATPRLVDFHTENVDVAIRYGKGQYAGLASELLFEEFVFPVCSPALLRHAPLEAPLSVMKGLPLIHDTTAHLESDLPNWRSWLAQQGVDGIDCDKGLYLNSLLAVQAAVDGRGVLLGRSVIVADDLAAGRLVRPFAIAHKVPHGYHFVHPPERDSPKVRAFRSWLVEEVMLTRGAEILVGG